MTWPKWAKVKGHKPDEVFAAVQGALEVMRGRPVTLNTRCATDAKCIIGLWRALEQPPWAEFGAELKLVAEAFQDCPDPLFARDVRAVGWDGGKDRRRSVSTLCVQARYGDRLDVAQQWVKAGRPSSMPSAPSMRGDYEANARRYPQSDEEKARIRARAIQRRKDAEERAARQDRRGLR